MKKNFLQLNKQIASKPKKQPDGESSQKPLTIPDKIKNIEKKLEKFEQHNLQQRILEQMRSIKEELKEIKSNINMSSSGKKTNRYEQDVEESIVKTNKSKSIGKQELQDALGNHSIKIKEGKTKRAVADPKEIIPPGSLQSYLKDYKVEGNKPAPYYFGYIKKNSAPIFIKYSTKSLEREADAYRKLWRDIVKARWICINRMYDVSQAQINFLILDKNIAGLEGLPVHKVCSDIIKILEFIHNCGFLYRNMSPEHFMLSADKKLVVLDFKNARRFVDVKGNHLQVSDPNYQCGDFGSTAQLRLTPEGRKDDLESLGYMALHLLGGEVPWKGMGREEMMKCRNGLTLQQLYKSIPQWLEYMKYVHKLNRVQKPDYNYLIDLVQPKQ